MCWFARRFVKSPEAKIHGVLGLFLAWKRPPDVFLSSHLIRAVVMLSLKLGFPKSVAFTQGNLEDNLANKHIYEIQTPSTQMLFLTAQKWIINKRLMESLVNHSYGKWGHRLLPFTGLFFPSLTGRFLLQRNSNSRAGNT